AHRRPGYHAVRGHDLHVEHQIFDVAVAVLLHAAGVGGNPAADGRKFEAVGLVPQHQLVLAELLGDVPPDRTRLDAGRQIDGIDPQDAIQAAHVDGDHEALFAGRQTQCIGDVRAAAEGDQAGAVSLGGLHELHHLLVASGEHHQIRHALELAVADGPDLGARVPVAAAQPYQWLFRELVGSQETEQIGN